MMAQTRPAGARLAEGVAALVLAGALHLLAVAAIMPQLAAGEGNGAPKIVVAAAPEAWSRLAANWGATPTAAPLPEGQILAPPAAPSAMPDARPADAPPRLPPAPEAAVAAAPAMRAPPLPPAPPTLGPPPRIEAPPSIPSNATPAGPTPAPSLPAAAPRDGEPGAPPPPVLPPPEATVAAPERPPLPAPPAEASAPAGDPPAPAQSAPAQSTPVRAAGRAGAEALSEAERRWQAETRRLIEGALRLPRGARARQARVGIGFEVDALGRLVSVEVMAPSGQPALDAAAVAAVRAAAPFAPPPAGPITARFTINLGR